MTFPSSPKRFVPLLFCVGLGWAGSAFGATYYVDGSCSTNGNGQSAACASSANGTGAFTSPSGCLASMSGGDTCSIAAFAGQYVGTYNYCGTSSHNLSGTSGAYTTFKGTGSSKPKLCRDSGCQGWVATDAAHVVLGDTGFASPCRYIKLDGFEIHGYVKFMSDGGAGVNHVTLTNSDISGAGDCDGNDAVMRAEDTTKGTRAAFLQIDHNLFHNLNGCNQGSVGGFALLKFFNVTDSIVEYNTFDSRTGHVTSQGMIDDKDSPLRNTFRYNQFFGASNIDNAIRIGMQHNGSRQGGDQFYGNVATNNAIVMLEGTSTDLPWSVHHNTFYGVGGGSGDHPGPELGGSSGTRNFTFKDNLVDCAGVSCRNVTVTAPNLAYLSTDAFDYNRYDADGDLYYGGNGYSGGTSAGSVSAWASSLQGGGCAGCEAHSTEAATPCAFVNSAAGDFRIKDGDFCKTASSTGGEVGAYGVTSCVGYQCGGTSQPSCGNGIVETGEVCDDGNAVTETACPYGQPTCVACNATCAQVLNLAGPYCGDGIVNGGESCDGAQLGGSTCATLGFTDGILTCASNCAFNTSACQGGRTVSSECGGAPPSWILCDGFESGDMSYWSNDLNTDGGRLTTTTTAPHGGANAAQESYAAGTPGDGWGAKFFGDHPLLQTPGAAVNDFYLRWWSKFSPGFAFPSTSAKSWIVAAFESWSANYPGPNTWSPFYIIVETRPDGTSTLTIHRKVPVDEWQSLPQNIGTPVAPATGAWHEMQVHLKLNTPGASDGVAEMWIDGTQKASYTSVNFRGTYSRFGWNHLVLSPYASPSSPSSQTQYWDGVVGSTAFVSGVADTVPPPAPTIFRTDKK